MAKPIAIIYVPGNLFLQNGQEQWSFLNGIVSDFNTRMPDYYWLAFPDPEVTKVYLKVFHEKDFTEIQYEELLKLVNDKLNDQHPTG